MKDLSRFAPTVRGLRLYSLYGGISAAGYVGTVEYPPESHKRLQWWGGLFLVVLTAWKALGSTSPADKPHDDPAPQ